MRDEELRVLRIAGRLMHQGLATMRRGKTFEGMGTIDTALEMIDGAIILAEAEQEVAREAAAID